MSKSPSPSKFEQESQSSSSLQHRAKQDPATGSPHALYLIQRHLTHRQFPNRRPRNKLSRSLMCVLGIFHTPWHFLGGFE